MERSTSSPVGHLFIINGDMTKLQCDAVLLPTDAAFNVTKGFASLVGRKSEHQLRRKPSAGWTERSAHPWPGWTSGPRVWLGHLGGDETTEVRHFVTCAINFIRAAAADARARGHPGALPVLGLPVVGSGHGGGAKRRGEILRDLIPELANAAVHHKVDIVLVTWGRVTYDAAQDLRRKHFGNEQPWARHLTAAQQKVAADLANKARAGNLVVFIGAGVSATAGLPAWQKLLDEVATELSFSPRELAQMHELDVRDQATLLSAKGKDFIRSVEKALRTGYFSLAHGLLASLPVREFVTTNFDDLLERAARGPGNALSVVPGSDLAPSSRWLVKLHGTLGRNLVLTRAEYRDARSQQNALFGLLHALLITKHMLFVGYSLQDEDFNDVMHDVRLLHQQRRRTGRGSPTATKQVGTVLVSFENQQFRELWSDLRVTALSGRRRVEQGTLSKASQQEWARVARTMSLLLDLVALQSADDVSFVLDERTRAVGGSASTDLAGAISELRRVYELHCDDNDPNAPKWSLIRSLIDSIPNDGRQM
jgi:hypothetical protein